MNTWEIIPAIEAKIKEVIEGLTFDVELKIVVIGNKTRSSLWTPPLIWVAPPPEMPIVDQGMALNEAWYPRYSIIGVVESYKVDIGKAQAEKLALQASAALIIDPVTGDEDRTLGGLCRDIVRTKWIPAHNEVTTEDNIFGSGVEVEIRLNTKEA